ncbi:MAG: hypothetical protein J1F09_01935 [Oscillospiraceae bacterium]|nr:hypothetical protein [Oscillospiraceae bacterium]
MKTRQIISAILFAAGALTTLGTTVILQLQGDTVRVDALDIGAIAGIAGVFMMLLSFPVEWKEDDNDGD